MTKEHPSCGKCNHAAIGIYGKIIIILTSVRSTEDLGSNFSPTTGGTVCNSGCGGCPMDLDPLASEGDEHDMVPPDKCLKPSYHSLESAATNNTEPDYVDTHYLSEETKSSPCWSI